MTPTKKKRRSLSRATMQRTTLAFVTPMAAQVVKRLPEGDEWTYELKFDGYRALIIKDEQRVEFRSRKNKDLAGMYQGIKWPAIVARLAILSLAVGLPVGVPAMAIRAGDSKHSVLAEAARILKAIDSRRVITRTRSRPRWFGVAGYRPPPA